MFCQECPKKAFCSQLCPEAEAYANQDRQTRREYFSFPETRKGAYKWNEADWTVTSNRTESLDASARQILGAPGDAKGTSQVILPKRCQLVEEFALHLHSVAKRLEEDEGTGYRRYVYVKLNPDHLGQGVNNRSALNFD